MKRFLAKIVSLMKEERLFGPQGGPIILAQVENEYGNVEGSYGIGGELYVKWAAETAVSLNTSVPWVMCQQTDAPDPITENEQKCEMFIYQDVLINTCNGFYCDGFTPNSPSKPPMWTENYSGWFLSFGYPIPYRPIEDLAFAVARFFERGGTFQNYYMYFGGTNFGRTAGGPLIATSYDYDAPIDEYGFIRQPKWGHLRDLHMAIRHCEDYLVEAYPSIIPLGLHLEAHVYYKSSNDCAAFLANYDSKVDANVTFNGISYFLPAWSVSILPDCKNVIFNTAEVISQKSPEDVSFITSGTSLVSSPWSWYKEKVGIWGNNTFVASSLLEQINTTRDTSDFLWYTTRINVEVDLKNGQGKEVGLLISSLGHAALLFVNKRLVGFGYGNHDDASFLLTEKITLKNGENTLDILSLMVGLQNYGPWFDIAGAGIYSVILTDLNNAKKDLSSTKWTYQVPSCTLIYRVGVGLEGESLGLEKLSLANSSLWIQGKAFPINQTLIWYKGNEGGRKFSVTSWEFTWCEILNFPLQTTFLAPGGNGPVSLNLSSMGKGQAWVNGQGIGRYWPGYLSPSTGCSDHCDYRGSYDSSKCLKKCGQPAQTLYHIPRTWLHAGENLLVLHEEVGGDPSKISVLTRTGEEICGIISQSDHPPPDTWKPKVGFKSVVPQVRLSCDEGWHIASVSFASYGTPKGNCGAFIPGSCHLNVSTVVQKICVGKQRCSIPVSKAVLGNPCPGVLKTLAIQVLCSD
ncbi:hypothetical protein M9H77_25772 [Catharanthus roseus]|uniref:Uncharacterized protein n=1 Tax=Catharanthus roseus TaxID=4058 RepID=A0ACC0A838_CATRO|nr:hypothetical protein M9H77_25772 [Catharanthus roseus]